MLGRFGLWAGSTSQGLGQPGSEIAEDDEIAYEGTSIAGAPWGKHDHPAWRLTYELSRICIVTGLFVTNLGCTPESQPHACKLER